jgi:hypothetical protein
VCVYYCSTYYKDVQVCVGGNNAGHELREEEGERERERARGLPTRWPPQVQLCSSTGNAVWHGVCVFITAVPITKLFVIGTAAETG